jgi:Ca2+-binding EF-hand superfamily protein
MSEEKVLEKSFKYYDLNNNGFLEMNEFIRALEKVGMPIQTKQVSLFLLP